MNSTLREKLLGDKDILKFMAKYRYQYRKEMKSDLVALIQRKQVEARIDENQRRLDKIHEWRNRKPVPGELTTANFGSAGAAMEISGFERSFEERVSELKEVLEGC